MLYIVTSADKKPKAGEAKSIRVAASSVVTKEGTTDPKAVVSLYEDFLCPHCGAFEQQFGPTINQLIDSGAIAADYYMVAILDQQGNGLLVARVQRRILRGRRGQDAQQGSLQALPRRAVRTAAPGAARGSYPDNARLIEIARQAGAGGSVPDCINKGRYVNMAQGLAQATGINSTPTVKINGQEFAITETTKPEDLVAKVKEIVGDVPGLHHGAARAESDSRSAP